MYVSKYLLHFFGAGVCRYIVVYNSCKALSPGSISEVHWITLHNASLEGNFVRPATILAYDVLHQSHTPYFSRAHFKEIYCNFRFLASFVLECTLT